MAFMYFCSALECEYLVGRDGFEYDDFVCVFSLIYPIEHFILLDGTFPIHLLQQYETKEHVPYELYALVSRTSRAFCFVG